MILFSGYTGVPPSYITLIATDIVAACLKRRNMSGAVTCSRRLSRDTGDPLLDVTPDRNDAVAKQHNEW